MFGGDRSGCRKSKADVTRWRDTPISRSSTRRTIQLDKTVVPLHFPGHTILPPHLSLPLSSLLLVWTASWDPLSTTRSLPPRPYPSSPARSQKAQHNTTRYNASNTAPAPAPPAHDQVRWSAAPNTCQYVASRAAQSNPHAHAPPEIDHSPHVHPAAPSPQLPESFASYREKATQHGPLKSTPPQSSTISSASSSTAAPPQHPLGEIGGKSAKELGPIRIGKGEYADRSELPQRFHRTPWSTAEIEAIESGGASLYA